MAGCVFPMFFVVAYAMLQALSGDYKEMMTAVIAVMLSLYHIARTAWGLAQLREYVRWCEYTLQCIKASSPKSGWVQLENETTTDDEAEEEPVNLDTKLMVNSDIVDNEFIGRDVSISLSSWRDWSLKIADPMVSTVRWAAAFQCSLGHEWKTSYAEPLSANLQILLHDSLLYCEDESTDTRPVSFRHLIKDSDKCGAFGGQIPEILMGGLMPFETYKFEFDNIVSSYFSEDEQWMLNRMGAHVETVEYTLVCRILGPQKLKSISANHQKLMSYRCTQQVQDAVDFLLGQCCYEEKVECIYVPWLWKLILVPQWSLTPNAFVLQASAFVDIRTALNVGCENWMSDELHRIDGCGEGEAESFRSFLQSVGESYTMSCILGVSLDSVRTLLARWILHHSSSINASSWHPPLPNDVIHILLREQETSFTSTTEQAFLISVFQSTLAQQLAQHSTKNQQLPYSAALIGLFLLSYPALSWEVLDEDGSWTGSTYPQYLPRDTRIRPAPAPQKIAVSVVFNASTRIASLRLISENQDINFEWELWINAALGIIKSYNIVNKERESDRKNVFIGPLNLIKDADLSLPMITLDHRDDDAVLSNLPGQLYIWTAWPIFDVRFCQFELDQWMDACDPLPVDEFDSWDSNNEYKIRKRSAMRTLTKISTWNRTCIKRSKFSW